MPEEAPWWLICATFTIAHSCAVGVSENTMCSSIVASRFSLRQLDMEVAKATCFLADGRAGSEEANGWRGR
jgi:hypothetical protein